MDFKNLIIECLGLQDVDIENFVTDRENLKLTVTVLQQKEKCRCHCCDSPLGYVREWKDRLIRGPAMGAFLYVEIILWQCAQPVQFVWTEFVQRQFRLCIHIFKI